MYLRPNRYVILAAAKAINIEDGMMDSMIFSNVMVKSKLSRHPCTAGPKDASSGHPAGFVVAMAVECDELDGHLQDRQSIPPSMALDSQINRILLVRLSHKLHDCASFSTFSVGRLVSRVSTSSASSRSYVTHSPTLDFQGIFSRSDQFMSVFFAKGTGIYCDASK